MEQNIKSPISNCAKYDFNELSQNYSCVLCKVGFFLKEDVCEETCGTIGEDIQTYPSALVLDKIGVGDNFTSYKVKSVDTCVEL